MKHFHDRPADTAGPPARHRKRRLRKLAVVAATAAAAFGVAFGTLVPAAEPAVASAPTPSPVVDSPNGRGDVILNMFQWTWDSVAAECKSTIGPAGFGYVQVSPPQEHIQGTAWWTSYQPVSYKLESKLGNRAEFQNMIDTCKDAGVGIIADAVINHTAGADTGSGTGTGGTSYSVDNFPGVPYGSNDFNDCRKNISNYRDRYDVQNCRLLSLQDLRTGSDDVRGKIAGYMNDLIGMGVAGFRIDAAKHIPAADLAAIKAKLTNPNIYWVHEVIGAAGEPIQPSEYLGSGDSHEFNYARELKSRFDGQIKDLRSIGDGKLPSDRAGVFVDNHDTERNGETMNYKWGAKYKLANTFMLSWPYGSPSVYSGYKWDNKDAGAPGASATSVPDADCANSAWVCTQRWTETAGMVGFHNAVAGTGVTNWWDNGGNHIAYGRGDKGYVSINNTASAVTRTYQTSLPAGNYCDVIASKECEKTYTVNSSGDFTATIPAYGALALQKKDVVPTECDADTQAPSVPGGVKATADGTALAVSWSASTDNCAEPITYDVAATAGDSTVKATATGTSTTLKGLKENTTYSVTVTAVDGSAAKNRSQASAAISVKTGGGTNPTGSTEVFYSTARGWSDYNIHYKVGSGTWTTAPGAAMSSACEGWVSRKIDTGEAATVTAAFNNGRGAWDNNGGKDYTLQGSTVAVSDDGVTTKDPCGDDMVQDDASFTVNATTQFGQSVYVVGSIPALGSWAPSKGTPLSAAAYPNWQGEVDLPAGTSFEYKYVKIDEHGSVVWEPGENRRATVSDSGAVTLTDTWRS